MRRNNRMRIFNRKTPLRFALEHITFRCVPRRSKTTARALWLTARSLSYLLGDPYHLHIAPRQEGLREVARHPCALAAQPNSTITMGARVSGAILTAADMRRGTLAALHRQCQKRVSP